VLRDGRVVVPLDGLVTVPLGRVVVPRDGLVDVGLPPRILGSLMIRLGLVEVVFPLTLVPRVLLLLAILLDNVFLLDTAFLLPFCTEDLL
jgi:hypothetical protein